MPALKRLPRAWVVLGAASLCAVGCDLAYPEVVVTSHTGEGVLIRNVSFNGCVWSTVLAEGDSTAPDRCLPGVDHVHLQRFDAQAYCEAQWTASGDDCPLGERGGGGFDASAGSGGTGEIEAPRWFNYRTVSTYEAGYGDWLVLEVEAAGLEQDFAVPGPYGH